MKTTNLCRLLMVAYLVTFKIGSMLAQCTLLTTAVPGLTLTHQRTDCGSNTGVAYNPNLGLYYAVRAGLTTYPLETWSSTGTPLFQNNTGFDYRGLWWNPNTNQLEANGFSTQGIWKPDLNVSGYALTTGSNIFTGMAQPNSQSVGDYDYDANEIIYYDAGSIYRYSRATDALLGSYAITGLPAPTSNLNSNTAMYTGCLGKEIALLDYVNKRVYLINKNTHAYVGSSDLPATAVTTSIHKTSWANGLIWLFKLTDRTWYSYQVFDITLPVTLLVFNAEFSNEAVQIGWSTATEENSDHFIVERSMDGSHYAPINNISAAGNSTELLHYAVIDEFPGEGLNYYRLQQVDINGSTHTSNVVPVNVQFNTEVSVFPNPVKDELQITGENIAGIVLLDALGEAVISTNANSTLLDMRSLPPGVYYARIDINHQIVTKKIVKE